MDFEVSLEDLSIQLNSLVFLFKQIQIESVVFLFNKKTQEKIKNSNSNNNETNENKLNNIVENILYLKGLYEE